MTNLSKLTWKSIIPSCNKGTSHNSRVQDRSAKPVSNQSSFKRLSLSDFSNSDSPLMSADDLSNSFIGSKLHVFTFAELREITNNFNSINLLGEGGFGPVYKGFVDDKFKPRLKAQPVAVKLLDLDGMQGHKEWMAEIIFLGQLRHPHLVKLIGYCWEGEHRLLVYEYMARGSLENQLFRRYSIPMPWSTRMKIAAGAAKGLAFLHEGDKPVIFRDFKASNILLDSDYTAKVSDFGLAKDGPEGNDTHVSTRIMGTHGYAAPEYIMTGHLTTMSDVYSFGVVLLELITGKRSMDKNRPHREQCLVEWARPLLRDPRKLDQVMDLRLDGQFPTKDARKVTALAYKCLSHYARSRPTMIDVVKILETIQEFDDPLELVSPIVYIVPNNTADDKGKGNKGKERNGKIEDDEKLSNCHGWRRRIKLPLPQATYGNINIAGNGLSREKRSSERKMLVKQSAKVI